MKTPGVLGFLCLLALSLAACGGDGDSDGETATGGRSKAPDVFFQPRDADALAHAALPAASDLPGGGWKVTARDEFDDEDDVDYDALAESEPACAPFAELSELMGGFGDPDELPAGRAQIEFEKPGARSLIPSNVQISVEIEETVEEVKLAWDLAKNLLEDEQMRDCFVAIFNAEFEESAEGFEAQVKATDASAAAPQDGVGMGFDIALAVRGVKLDMRVEMYFFPYANAGVTLLLIGDRSAMSSQFTSATLKVLETKLSAAAASQ